MKSNKFLDEKDPVKTRHFVRDFTVLLGNTGLRFGRKLKWKNCKVIKDGNKKLCEISLTADMTKNRKDRLVQGRRGDILERMNLLNYTKGNDFVFVDNHSGNEMTRCTTTHGNL